MKLKYEPVNFQSFYFVVLTFGFNINSKFLQLQHHLKLGHWSCLLQSSTSSLYSPPVFWGKLMNRKFTKSKIILQTANLDFLDYSLWFNFLMTNVSLLMLKQEVQTTRNQFILANKILVTQFLLISTGICLGSDQCNSRGGKRSGSCAQGFGVCCVFIISSSDGNQRLEQKVTYLRNTDFPASNTEDLVQTITLMPRDGDTTQYLLNFLTFKVPGIDNSLFIETNFLGAAFHQIKACLIDDLPSILHQHLLSIL